jgi:hypothetical protein
MKETEKMHEKNKRRKNKEWRKTKIVGNSKKVEKRKAAKSEAEGPNKLE